MERLLWVCLAGAFGTGARYLISAWTAERFGTMFPIGTLAVNLAGCFALALVVEAGVSARWPETTRLAVTAGFLGGFTTYSSFNFEATRLLEGGSSGSAAAYTAATVIGCFVSGWMGLVVGRQFFR